MSARHKRIALLAGTAAAGVPCNTDLAGTALTLAKVCTGARAIEERDARIRGLELGLKEYRGGEITRVWWDDADELLRREEIKSTDFYEPFATAATDAILASEISGIWIDEWAEIERSYYLEAMKANVALRDLYLCDWKPGA